MTIFADLCFMFIIGLLFPIVTFDRLRRAPLFWNKYFATALAFQTLFCMPLAILSYILYPDWCWMYWLDSRYVPEWVAAIAFLSYYISLAAGFAVAFLAEKRRRGLALRVVGIALLYFIIFAFLTFDRLFYVGTVEQYVSGRIPSLLSRRTLLLVLSVGMGLAFVVLLGILYRFGKELDKPWSREDQARLDRRMKVVSLAKFDGDVKASILSSLAKWNGERYIRELLEERNYNVIIKPNFCGGGRNREGTQTSVGVLSAIIDIIREISPQANITVVESDSIFWNVDVLLKGSPYEALFREKGVKFLNLSRERKVLHDFGGRIGEEEVAEILLRPHMLVDVPVAKTHAFYRMSGAIKNLLGLLPAKHKLLRYHTKGFADPKGMIFVDLYRNFPPDLVIVDGIVSCEGDGPCGTPKRTDFILTSDDALCADIVLSRIMGFRPEEIPYLALLKDAKCEPMVVGEPVERVKPPFWRHARKYGLLNNMVRIWRDNIKARLEGKTHP